MRKIVNPSDFGTNFVCEAKSKRIPSNDPNRQKGKLIRMVTLRCENCNKLFDVAMHNAKRIKQRCCSITCYKKLVEVFEGGNEKHPLYARWLSMTQRCTTPTHSSFKNYGQRGIYIEKYLTDFVNYVQYVISLPGYTANDLEHMTIDRINNNKSYVRGNLRWTNYTVQTINQRTRKNSSGYKGVTWNKRRNTWLVRVTYKGKSYCCSTHKHLKDAVNARNESIRINHLPHEIQDFQQV